MRSFFSKDMKNVFADKIGWESKPQNCPKVPVQTLEEKIPKGPQNHHGGFRDSSSFQQKQMEILRICFIL